MIYLVLGLNNIKKQEQTFLRQLTANLILNFKYDFKYYLKIMNINFKLIDLFESKNLFISGTKEKNQCGAFSVLDLVLFLYSFQRITIICMHILNKEQPKAF